MKITGKTIEANVRVFSYSSTEDFSYRAPQSLSISDGNIEFSLLIDIKQTAEIPGKSISVVLMRIFAPQIEDSDDGQRKVQRFRTIALGEIPLFDVGECVPGSRIVDPDDPLLLSDPWKIKQTVKWNFQNVRSDGPGNYAVALIIYTDAENGDSKTREFLDCDYFKVI